MKRFLKIARRFFLFLILTTGLLLLTSPFTLPALVKSTWFKTKLSALLRENLNREVRFNEAISLDFGFSPSLTVNGFEIDDATKEKKQPMLRVETLTISGPLWANLRGDLTIEEVLSDNVSVLYRQHKDGSTNWDFSGPDDEQAKSTPDEPGEILLPLIKKLELNNISIELALEENTRKLHFRSISAEDLNAADGGKLNSSLKVDGIPITLHGGLGSITKYLEGSPLNFKIDIAQDQNRIQADGTLHTNAKSVLNITASGKDLASLKPLIQAEFPPYAEYKIQARAVQTHDGGHESTSIENIKIKLDENNVSGTLGLRRATNGDLDFDADLVANANILKTSGTYSNKGSADLSVQVSGKQLAELSSLLKTELPPVEDYDVSANLKLTPGKDFRLEEVKLRIGTNDLQGDITGELSPLSITARLHSEAFDIGSIPTATAPVDPKEKKSNSEEETKIPYETLETFELDLSLTAKKLTAATGATLSDVSITAFVKDGVAEVQRFSGGLFGGSFESKAKIKDKRISLRLEASKIDAHTLSESTGGTPFLKGEFNIFADINGRGDTVDDLLKTLSGELNLNSENAQFESVGLHAASSGLADILSPLFRESEEANSECLIFNYNLSNGIAESDIQVLKLKQVFIFAEGQINLPENKLDYDFSVQSTSPAFASLIPPFRAFGKLDNPYFVPSVSGTVASVADSGETVVGAVTGVAQGATRFILGDEAEKLSGLAVCEKAYELEQKLLSSRVGNLIKGKKKKAETSETANPVETPGTVTPVGKSRETLPADAPKEDGKE